MPPAASAGYYAVRVGRRPGVYHTWAECRAEVDKYPGAVYKKFPQLTDAQAFTGRPGGDRSAPYTISQPGGGRSAPYGISQPGGGRPAPYTISRPGPSTAASRAPMGDAATPPLAGETRDGIVVYTDGASAKNGQRGAHAGVGVYFGSGDRRNVSERLCGPRQTNQRAELTAIVRAVQIADPAKGLHICTDSMYSIKCLTAWFPRWESHGWKSSAGAPVENQDLVKEALGLIRSRAGAVRFTHVRGHAGVPGNEAADCLAVAGALQQGQ
ncbi:hypothetical protein LPJ61_001248 [Coemansia biformis]|uniref:Ribonuclease H n=1 Tax=Coemansia biformis TaxID=1286918 RepID=A0A9W7YH31_9FUNG|nr:hypothetical protein LPJ61_001248 [Coemansia biformis]